MKQEGKNTNCLRNVRYSTCSFGEGRAQIKYVWKAKTFHGVRPPTCKLGRGEHPPTLKRFDWSPWILEGTKIFAHIDM
jgi:hypothetical protein